MMEKQRFGFRIPLFVLVTMACPADPAGAV